LALDTNIVADFDSLAINESSPPNTIMIQGSYLSTYRTYKAGTKRLATWLVQAAKLCGIDSTSSATDKYQIPLGKFVELAQTITESKDPRIKVPQEIIVILSTVIALRKNTGAKLAKLTGRSINHASQTSHRYFVSVLEQVLKILAPSPVPGTDEGQAVPGADISNMFAALTVEEPTLNKDTAGPTASKKKTRKQPSQEYEIEDSSTDDFMLAVLGFLEDYAKIELFVMETWMHYRDGRVNLMAASVVTDTAYGMIKRSSEDLLSSAPGKKKMTYYDIVTQFSDDEVVVEGEMTASISEEIAQYVALPAERLLSEFASILEPNIAPIYNGQFGYYQPDATLKKKTAHEQHFQDRQLLLEYLPEIAKMAKINLQLPAEDELTTGLGEMMKKNDIMACPMYAIFATKIFLSIHHVLRANAVQPFEELQATARRCVATIDSWFEFADHKQFANWPARNDQFLRQIQALARECALEDLIGKSKVKIPDQFQPESFLFVKRNPVYCGLLTLRLNLLLQEGGQNLVGAWGSAIYPIHLYNACRQSGGLDIEWQDAEYIYQLHTPQRLFVGAPPKDPQDYLKRFFLMLGGSVSNFARNRRHGGQNMIVESKKGPRGLKSTTPVRDIFQPRYVADGNAVLSTGNLIALVSTANKAQRTHEPLVNVEQLAHDVTSQPQMTPVQLLTCVREGLAAEEMHLLFDYFRVHQRGIRLLRTLEDALHADMVEYFGEGYIEDDSQLPYVVGYIFEIVHGADKAAERLQLPYHGSKILNKASDVLKAYLEKDNTGLQGVAQTKALTRTIQYAHANKKLQDVQIWDPQRRQSALRGGI
jgi:hypothetical protein